MASDALKRRLLTAAVAGLAAAIGLLLAGGFAFGSADRYVALGVAWLGVALALMLEPSPRASSSRTLLAAGAGTVAAAVLTLGVGVLVSPSWYAPDEDQASLGGLLAYVWTFGDGVRIVVVLTLAGLPAPVTLLVVRRFSRQLEWQALAAALGPVFVGLALFPAEVFHAGPLLVLVLAGLPSGLAAYLLDRRLLGPTAVEFFPEPPPAEPTEPAPGSATEPPATITRVVLVARPDPFALIPLAFVLALAAAWAFVVAHVGHALAPSYTFPGLPELAAMFDEVAAQQEEHRARTGAYARTLGALEALPLDVRGGETRGYVLRYARIGEARWWILAADPVPARPGWPSLRLVGPGGQLERGVGPFLLSTEAR